MCILFLFENTRLQTLLSQGKLVWKETVTEEFENLPQAFVGMLRGDSVDKPHVKAWRPEDRRYSLGLKMMHSNLKNKEAVRISSSLRYKFVTPIMVIQWWQILNMQLLWYLYISNLFQFLIIPLYDTLIILCKALFYTDLKYVSYC